MLREESSKAPVLFIGGLRWFVARGEDELESTAVDYALVLLHSGRVNFFECVITGRQGSLVGSGLAAQAGGSTVNEAAVELLHRCLARELSRFKAAGEDRETGQNREAVATERLDREKFGEHGEEWWWAQATAASRAVNTTSSSNFAVSCIEDALGKEEKRKR
jgi:hypothetical protein